MEKRSPQALEERQAPVLAREASRGGSPLLPLCPPPHTLDAPGHLTVLTMLFSLSLPPPPPSLAVVIEDDRIDEVLKGMTEKSPAGV